MGNRVHVFDFLSKPAAPPAVCVLFGAEPFLKSLALQQLRSELAGDNADDLSETTYVGDDVEWRDVRDELSTMSLFGAGTPRFVVVQDADGMVKKFRSQLEDYVAKPSSAGVLTLLVDQWQSNTRLYKAVDKTGLPVQCSPPEAGGRSKAIDRKRVVDWLARRSLQQHAAKLDKDAAELLLDLRGLSFGILDQELAKMALFAGIDGSITSELVQEVVGGWKGKTIWELIDAAADGNTAEALRQLDRLLQSGESPIGLYAQMSWSLRRFAAAAHHYEQAERSGKRIAVRQALLLAGFREWPQGALERAGQQLKQLGRRRAGRLYDWLLEVDLSLKSTHSADDRARFALERLLLRLARDAMAVA